MSKPEDSKPNHQRGNKQSDSGINKPHKFQKVKSIYQVARYQVGMIAWWVPLRQLNDTSHSIPPELSYMNECHPKILYERGPYKKHWRYKSRLPKLHHDDFLHIIGILTSELIIEKFCICDIIRSKDTGEFYYSNDNDEWMPEAYLFDTHLAAERERKRIIKMIGKWVNTNTQ